MPETVSIELKYRGLRVDISFQPRMEVNGELMVCDKILHEQIFIPHQTQDKFIAELIGLLRVYKAD
jgi:hypothetical protein